MVLLSDFSSITEYEDTAPNAVEFRGSYHKTHPITRNFNLQLNLQYTRTVELVDPMPDRVTGTSLLRTTPDTWGETDIVALQEERGVTTDSFEVRGPNNIAVAATYHTERATLEGGRSKDARVVVMGDADSTSNQLLGYSGNSDLILNMVAWLTENEDLIAIRPRGSEGQVLILSATEQRTVVWLSVLGALQGIIIIGFLSYLYRRRFQ